jgi:hypothetical protein
MPFTEFETARIEAAMSDFMAKRPPPVEIRGNAPMRISVTHVPDVSLEQD